MKNIKRIAYMVVIVILVVLSLTIYTNASKNDKQVQKDKVFAEIKYLETKMANLLNSMNHIEARNYSVISSEISKETTEKSNSGNSSSNQGSKSGGASSQEGSSGEQSSRAENKEVLIKEALLMGQQAKTKKRIKNLN